MKRRGRWELRVCSQVQVTLDLGGEKSGDHFSLLLSNGANAMQQQLQREVPTACNTIY